MNMTTFISQRRFLMPPIPVVPSTRAFPSLRMICEVRRLVRNLHVKRRRSGQTYESFACFFAGRGIPESLLEGAYAVLAGKSLFASFPVLPQDSLSHTYGIDCYRDNGFTELSNAIQTLCPIEFCKPVPVFLPCETVEHLVCLLAARCNVVYPSANQTCPVGASDSGGQRQTVISPALLERMYY